MFNFEKKENPILKEIFNLKEEDSSYLELIKDETGNRFYLVEGGYWGGIHKTWEYSNHKEFIHGVTKDDLIGKLLQFFFKKEEIKSIEYEERGTVYVVRPDNIFFSGFDLAECLLLMANINVRSQEDFS